MVSKEDFVTIKNLKAKNPDMSLREIGRLLHASHNTIKAALAKEEAPKYQRVEKPKLHLEPFAEVIFEMVNIKRYRGSRILNELISKGYKGGKTAFYNFLRNLKLDLHQKHFKPYETSAGEQAQFDWSPYTVLIDGKVIQIIAYSYINSFSRYQVFEVSLSQNQASVFEALENSIIESGGVASRIQTDNAKVFVDNASRDNLQYNKHYLNFASHYSFSPSRSLPAHPWSKGKIEKPFQYLETHFIAGGEFTDFLDLQYRLKDFQKHVNQRLHSTTKAVPNEMFLLEQPHLIQLPTNRYIGVKEEVRKVSSDCLISYNGSRYSVPYLFASKQVWIRISKGHLLQVYSQANKKIAEHPVSLKKGIVIIKEEHYRGNRNQTPNFERLRAEFIEQFPSTDIFLEKLKAQKRINPNYHLCRILEISKMYKKEDFYEAINCCIKYNVFSANFISGYLEKNHKHIFKIKEPIIRIATSEPVTRDLSEYRVYEN
ncbi:MAG: IS21 family transposase [Bacteroidota bacterium]